MSRAAVRWDFDYIRLCFVFLDTNGHTPPPRTPPLLPPGIWALPHTGGLHGCMLDMTRNEDIYLSI